MNNPFKCPDCGATFKNAAGLGSHKSRVHGIAGKAKGKHPKKKKRAKAAVGSKTSLIEAVLVLEMENKAEARVIARLKGMLQ